MAGSRTGGQSNRRPFAHRPLTIDVHCHAISPELLQAARRGGARYGVELVERDRGLVLAMEGGSASKAIPPELTDLDARLAAMDRQGVDVQVLSSWADFTGYGMPARQGAAFSRLQNETLAELVRSQPSRFVGSATVPLQDPELAAQVLEDALARLDLRAVQIATQVGETQLDDPRLDRFWSAAASLGVLVLVHPYAEQALPALRPYYLSNLVGNPWQTSVALARLLFGGVLERHPVLRVSFAHGGGFLPYQVGRLGRGFASRPETRAGGTTSDPRSLLRRCYFDTVLNDPRAIRYLAETVGSDRLLLGSDYPFESGDPDPVSSVRAALPPTQQASVLSSTAAQLLGVT